MFRKVLAFCRNMTARITTDGQGLVPERYRYQSGYQGIKVSIKIHRLQKRASSDIFCRCGSRTPWEPRWTWDSLCNCTGKVDPLDLSKLNLYRWKGRPNRFKQTQVIVGKVNPFFLQLGKLNLYRWKVDPLFLNKAN